jgi:pyruvate/2-oxoglutarate dehydrogenase complex dihydrolipoamide dehydrogenase (E3) component
MRRTRADISPHDSVWRAQELGVDMFLGAARFLSRSVVEVDGKHLHFHKAVIASGARPVVPAIPGLQEAGYYTNETIFSLDQPHPPRHLMVIGGGPIGCELAQAFARLGSQVTILQREPQFLPREDRDAALLLAQALQNDGISVHLACEVLEVVRQGEQRRLHLRSEGRELTIEGDAILVATGRQANVEGFGLEHAGVEYDGQRGVLVNDYLQTTNPNIYAAGDVCLSHKFTHTADAAARLVLRNALFFGRGRMSSLTIPWCTYTDPEIAHVGMYEREATARGIQLQTIQVPFQTVDRAITENATQGFLKIHVEASSDRILGATVVGEHAGDLISEITLAMVHRIGLSSIANVVHPYPTRAEALRKAADQFNRGRLTPRLRRWMSGWFSLWR